MRTISQVLDELGSIEYERIELARMEAALEQELDEIEEAIDFEAIEQSYAEYYNES